MTALSAAESRGPKESRLPVSMCVYYVYTIFMFNFHNVSKIASNIRVCTMHGDIKSRNINKGEEVVKSGKTLTIHGKKETRIIHGDNRKITDAWVTIACISVK